MEHIQYKDCKPFIPDIQYGKVIKVYDGDTITIAAKLPYESCPYYRWSVRLKGIDCPEMKSKNANEKVCAKIAQKTLSDLILNQIVEIKDVELEKYGRVLANVYFQNIHLSSFMIEKKLAVVYNGKTKTPPEDWLEYHMKE